MLFNDPSCNSQNTIKSQIQNMIPQFLGSDWFGIIVLSNNLKYKVDARCDINNIGDEIVLDFLSTNNANLFQQNYKPFDYKIYEYKSNHFAIIPIRSADSSIVFFLHCKTKASGPFYVKDLEWNKTYSKVAYNIVILNNELIQEHDYLENVLDSTESAILVFDLNYKVISLNEVAKNLFDLNSLTTNNNLFNLSTLAISIDRLNIQDIEEFRNIFERVISTGNKECIRNFMINEHHILNVTVCPLTNSKNVICGVIVVGSDVTKYQILEYELERAKNYALLGEIAQGLAHDVKNPLTNIKGCAALLKKYNNISDTELNYLNLIIQEVDRIDSIIYQMLSFRNVVKNNTYTLLDVNDVIHNCIQIINRQKVNRNINVLYDFDKNLPLMKAENTDLQQIFLNVLVNSLEAIGSNGVITIKSQYNNTNETLFFTISDTGIGIEKDNFDKLFNPYYTTKNNGTGLGLYIVKKVLDKYNGEIKICSTPFKGTVVEISFPKLKTNGDVP